MNEKEMQTLHGENEFLYKLYFHGIRRYMDYETGIVGIKREISIQSLREAMYVEPGKSISNSGSPHKSKVFRGIEKLIKLGLLSRMGNPGGFIFFLPLATSDNSVKNKVETKSKRSRNEVETEIETEINKNKNEKSNTYIKKNIKVETTKKGNKNYYQAKVGTPPYIRISDIEKKKSTKKEKSLEGLLLLPIWLNEILWDEFVEHRKEIKKPMTVRAKKMMIEKLNKFRQQGEDIEQALKNSIVNGWQDIYINNGRYKQGVNHEQSGLTAKHRHGLAIEEALRRQSEETE